MPRVVHFEICGENPEQLIKFYENVLVGSSKNVVLWTIGLSRLGKG